MRFEVEIERDLTADEIRLKMKELQGRDHSRYNAFICCILSHGNKGIVLGKDGIPVELAKIIGKNILRILEKFGSRKKDPLDS